MLPWFGSPLNRQIKRNNLLFQTRVGMGWYICVRVCLGVGGVKACVIAKLSVRKNARVFI